MSWITMEDLKANEPPEYTPEYQRKLGKQLYEDINWTTAEKLTDICHGLALKVNTFEPILQDALVKLLYNRKAVYLAYAVKFSDIYAYILVTKQLFTKKYEYMVMKHFNRVVSYTYMLKVPMSAYLASKTIYVFYWMCKRWRAWLKVPRRFVSIVIILLNFCILRDPLQLFRDVLEDISGNVEDGMIVAWPELILMEQTIFNRVASIRGPRYVKQLSQMHEKILSVAKDEPKIVNQFMLTVQEDPTAFAVLDQNYNLIQAEKVCKHLFALPV